MPNISMNGHGNGFDLMGVIGTNRGFVPDVDPLIKSQLDDLNLILARRIFPRDWLRQSNLVLGNGGQTKVKGGGRATKAQGVNAAAQTVHQQLELLLTAPLTPKRIPANDWAHGSLAYQFKHAPDSQNKISLSNLVDATAELSTLKYAVLDDIETNLYNFDFASRTILGAYPAIRDYLIAYAYHVMSLDDDNAVKNFMVSNPAGVNGVADYAIVSGARAYIDREKLKVADYNDDQSAIVREISAADLTLDADSFSSGIKALVADNVFNSKELELLDYASKNGFGDLPPDAKPILVKFIQYSPVKIDHKNILYFLPAWLQQIAKSSPLTDRSPIPSEQSDLDFEIKPFEEDRPQMVKSRSAVMCASQLFYVMTAGDELEVFNAINYFTHKYLVRGSLTIDDSRLREDLQSYVFSNRFTDLRTNKLVDRTRPAERAMFYRQVFDYGQGDVTEDVIVNEEFPRLWKVLMLESANYLERAQISPNPDNYVPRQNVIQAVEDLQYNLSTNCTGMSNVITPLIYAELDFVIRRIFMHPEILRQVVPSGGTWWRVIETLYMGMKNVRPKSTVIYNKAKLGHDIIRSIADYDPAVFARGEPFSAFISNVQRFITTQSILQDALRHDLRPTASGDAPQGEAEGAPAAPRTMMGNSAAANNGAAAKATAGSEWDF